ncbi:MAG: serine hydrolase domain-containing protein [Pyrinomonadaceae bacterium]
MFIVFAVAFNTSYAQGTDAQISKQIDELYSRYNAATPGVAVAVVRDGKVVFKKGYGSANLEYGQPISTKTVFNIASVSKQFTAFSIYLLEKQGKLSLENDVRKYIPELPDFGKTVRIKHLLGHTSGVRDALLALSGWRSGDLVTNENALTFLYRNKELNFEPESQFLYSNAGYMLLAEVVKRVSGQPFAEFARKNIFEPLGMSDTQILDDPERIVINRAGSYELENGVYKSKMSPDGVSGASNLYTTVEDMAKWAINLDKPAVGDAELIRRFNEPSLLNDGTKTIWSITEDGPGYHAKGQINWNYRGLHLISHGGHAAAFRSFLGRFPDKHLAIVALSNDEHYLNFVTSIQIAEMYLKDEMLPPPAPLPSTPAKNSVEPPNANLKDFEGRFYNADLDTAYAMTATDGKLRLFHIRLGNIPLTESGKDKFSGQIGFVSQIEFVRNASGAVTGFLVSNYGAKNVRFEKVTK